MSFSFENKRQVWLLIIIVMSIWLVFPFIFKSFMFWMDWVGEDLNTFAAYGPIGDIYGSLNTLFTSITLLVVLYTAHLQREANREDKKNVELQIKQSRHTVFSTMFYSLLEYKLEKANQMTIVTKKGQLSIYDVNNTIIKEFGQLLNVKWADLNLVEIEDVKNEFTYSIAKLTQGKPYTEYFNYFFIYESLFKLISNEELSSKDLAYYKDLISNSMDAGEQIALIWIASFSNHHKIFLLNSGIFTFGMSEDFIPFADKFLDQSLFSNPVFLRAWNNYRINKKTPA